MRITKDPLIVNSRVVDCVSGNTVGYEVGPSLGDIDGEISPDGMIRAIENGQVYQVQAYDDADPAMVIVKDQGGKKILTTSRDDSELNNLSEIKVKETNVDKAIQMGLK